MDITELEFLQEKYGDHNWGEYPPSKEEVAQWMKDWAEYQLNLNIVKNQKELLNWMNKKNHLLKTKKQINELLLDYNFEKIYSE